MCIRDRCSVAPSQESAGAGKVKDGHAQHSQSARRQVHILFLDDGCHQKTNGRMFHTNLYLVPRVPCGHRDYFAGTGTTEITASVGSSIVTVCPSGKTTSVWSAWRVMVRPLYFTVTDHGKGFFPLKTTRCSMLEPGLPRGDSIRTPSVPRNKPSGASPWPGFHSPMPAPLSA